MPKPTQSDHAEVTELPGGLLTAQQNERFLQRYAFAMRFARGTRILEVACGAGSGLGLWAAEPASSVVGVDYTASVLPYARRVLAELVQADAQALPLDACSFDTLICFEAIYYLLDPARFVREAARVLAPGGILLLCQSNPGWPGFVPGAQSVGYMASHELAAMLRQAGLSNVRLFGAFSAVEDSARRRMANQARRWVLRSGLMPTSGPVADALKALFYGRLVPVPSQLDRGELEHVALPLAALEPDVPDRRHRVIYACAER